MYSEDEEKPMNIRRATENDIDRLLELLSQVLEVHVEIRPDIFLPNTTKYREEELKTMVGDDNNPIYVIEDEKQVLGYAFCQIKVSKTPHLLKRAKTFYIDDLCIDETSRGKHLGETLFEYVKQEAKRLGCDEITLNCWAGNEPARRFYEKMGFKVRASIMECPID